MRLKGLGYFVILGAQILINADGSLGARNDLRAVSLEHKMRFMAVLPAS